MKIDKVFGFVFLFLLLLTSSCTDEEGRRIFSGLVKAPAATIERDVRGHEMIVSVQANLYYARWSNESVSYPSGYMHLLYGYGASQVPTPVPVFQTIEIRKNEAGAMVITSDRKAFDVVKGKDIYYILELKYYDVNGQLINYQFSTYDKEESDYSTLEQHQTMFSIQTHSLTSHQLTYPMTLDSLYYDKYLFDMEGGKLVRASMVTAKAVYAPADYTPAEEGAKGSLHYSVDRATAAVDATMSKRATEAYTDPKDGKTYYLYRTLTAEELNEKSKEIFSYHYRDTDPVEEPIGKRILQDDLQRERIGKPVGFLRKQRALEPANPLDHIGFKGMMQFKHADIAFQLRVAICHIIEAGNCRRGERCGKYIGSTTTPFIPLPAQEIPPSWNTYDLDYPLPFRVIADADGDKTQFVKDIQHFYPEAKEQEIEQMFAYPLFGDQERENDFFRRMPFTRF